MESTDPFDRQICIDGWDQKKITEQIAFVMGVGGLGCTVAFALARLGIKKIILWDKDKVDITNLNRQILFSMADIGRPKVDAAHDGLKFHLIGKTEVVKVNEDILLNWELAVKYAKESTVLFNNIDIGAYFDYACLSLAKSLAIPYAAGSSYSRQWIVEYFSGNKGSTSFSFENAVGKKEIFDMLSPNKIQFYKTLDFVEADDNPPTRTIGSNVLVASTAGLMTVNAWLQQLLGFTMPNFTKFDLADFWKPEGMIAWPAPETEEDTKK
eukprot:TRINITY_DN3029_c0_g1_i3.p1 TRINITY_DN3029_c0_g1~~TRINITY_DN3029_c0_g1_i3.p1  ORF type:complete len:268 (+),score=57.88 TRINITY_DN3029_c0_g1_i3:78-881(+)